MTTLSAPEKPSLTEAPLTSKKKPFRFRTIIFWLHLVAGLIAAPVIFIMSITGVLLTYEKQMTRWADARQYEITVPAGSPALPIADLIAAASESEKDAPTAITFRAGETAPAEVSFGREKTVFLDPYSGKVLGNGSPGVRKFFDDVTQWHRWLATSDDNRAVGKLVTGVSNLAFLVLVVSGIYLWFPRRWAASVLRNITWFRRNSNARARYFNWHNTFGFWCAVPLFFVVISATVISFPWASNLVYRAVGEEPPPPKSRSGGRGTGEGKKDESTPVVANLQPVFEKAQAQAGSWNSITINIPSSEKAPVSVNLDAGTGGQPQKRSSLEFNQADAELVKVEDFATQSTGRRVRSIMRFMHTGEVGGIIGQTIAGVASLGACFLVWTGVYLSWRRWRSRRSAQLSGDISS